MFDPISCFNFELTSSCCDPHENTSCANENTDSHELMRLSIVKITTVYEEGKPLNQLELKFRLFSDIKFNFDMFNQIPEIVIFLLDRKGEVAYKVTYHEPEFDLNNIVLSPLDYMDEKSNVCFKVLMDYSHATIS